MLAQKALKIAVRLGLAAGVLAMACSPTIVVPKEPERCKLQLVDMTILASERLNEAENGDSRPVQLRIYQLATDVHLNNADFHQVWKEDKAALGEDLVKVEELPVYPRSRTDIHFERDERALYIAAVALFRNPRGRTWYTVFELPPAPGKGDCRNRDGECDGGDCEKKKQQQQNPHYYVWLDGSRVDDGEDRVDDFPVSSRQRDMRLSFPDKGKEK